MTATIVGPMVPRHASGDTLARVAWLRGSTAPGTLWERVADDADNRTDWCPVCERTTVYDGEVCRSCGRVWGYDSPPENIPQRVERIAYDQNITRVKALRVAFAESRLEAARADK